MKKLSAETDFFILLLNNYALHKQRAAGDILREWNEKGLTKEIYDGYFGYHQEALQNAFTDIDSLMETGKHAY